MNTLTMQYRQLDKACALLHDQIKGLRSFERELFLPTAANKLQFNQKIAILIAQGSALDAPDEVFAMMKEQILNFLTALSLHLQSDYDRPMIHIDNLTRTLFILARQDSRDAAVRAALLQEKFAMADDLWLAIEDNLGTVSPLYLQELISMLETLKRSFAFERTTLAETFAGLAPDQLQAVSQCLADLLSKSEGWIAAAEQSMAQKGAAPQKETAEEDIIKLDETYYRHYLETELGVDLDDILAWHQEEVIKTRNNVFTLVNALAVPEEKPTTMQGVNAMLCEYAGAFETPEALMEKAQEYLDRARDAARKFVPLPEETCQLHSVPEQLKYTFPWGGYGGGCPLSKPLMGEYFVNDFNYTALTDGWIKSMALHEAYPGHHVQFVRSVVDRLPEVIKIGARSVPITEGTAHRSEHAFECVFAEDPFYPIFVAYRRHHTAVRIQAELWLRYFGKPIKEVLDLYQQELGFDRKTARGQVSAQENMLGYFNCYYYGVKRIEDLGEQFGFGTEEYTRYLFDAGRVSLSLLERFLALSPEDKTRYTNDFASLLQFEA